MIERRVLQNIEIGFSLYNGAFPPTARVIQLAKYSLAILHVLKHSLKRQKLPYSLTCYHLFCRIPPDEYAVYPNWLIVYFLQIITPMLGMVVIALKILVKNGRDLKRAFF